MASASYSLPQKLLDEMIVDEGPEGRELCGGLVMFHRTNRRDGPVIGKRIPKEGDECVIRWRERYTSGMNVSDGDEPCVIGTQTWVADEPSDDASGDGAARGGDKPHEPPGVHAALPLMESGDTVRLRLHASYTSNTSEPAACELELITFYRVDECGALRRKVAHHDEAHYKSITPLADCVLKFSLVEGFSAFALAVSGALVEAPTESTAWTGRARDHTLAAALTGLYAGDIALVRDGETFHRVDVASVWPVVDCSVDKDESVLKLEVSAPDHAEPAVRGTNGDVQLSVKSGLWVLDDEVVGDVESTPAVGAEPAFLPLSTMDPPLRLAVVHMAVGETAEVIVKGEHGAVGRYRVELQGVRNVIDVGGGTSYKVLNRGAKGFEPDPLDDVVVCVEDLEGDDGRLTALPLNLTWTLDDDEGVAGAPLEWALAKLCPGERALVTFTEARGPLGCVSAVVTLERVERRPSVIDLKALERIERAADLKTRGNRAFASKDFAKAVRRYGGGIDAAAEDLEPDLDEGAISERRALARALYLNRAAARLELKEFKGARQDCDAVLKREPRHGKALYRRGQCCLKLDDWAAAKRAFASALAVDETNKDARRGLQRVKEAVQRQKVLDRARFGGKTVAKGFSAQRPAPAPAEPAAKPVARNRRAAVAVAAGSIVGLFAAVVLGGWYLG